MERRINPKTGVIEENHRMFFFGDDWQPATNSNDLEERINPKTGVIEENHRMFFFGDDWRPKE